jgi:hypothetical protein
VLSKDYTFPKEVADEFMKHTSILLLDEISFFVLTSNDLKCLAFEVTDSSNISRHFNRNRRMAGDK